MKSILLNAKSKSIRNHRGVVHMELSDGVLIAGVTREVSRNGIKRGALHYALLSTGFAIGWVEFILRKLLKFIPPPGSYVMIISVL